MECVSKTSVQLTHMAKVRSRLHLRLNKELESNAIVCSTGECKCLLVYIRRNAVLRNNHNFAPSGGGRIRKLLKC